MNLKDLQAHEDTLAIIKSCNAQEVNLLNVNWEKYHDLLRISNRQVLGDRLDEMFHAIKIRNSKERKD